MTTYAILAVVVCAISSPAAAQTPCDLQGTWDLVSLKYDGQQTPPTLKSMKIFTKSRFASVGLDTKHHGPLHGAAELLDFYSSLMVVGGSYTVNGNTLTETLDYFADPAYLGLSLTFQCRQEGDRLFQTGTLPVFSNGKKTRDATLDEVWRRVERP